MAEVTLQMDSLEQGESCSGCDRDFKRGETMSAVEYANGEKAGWFCTPCIQNWNQTIAKGIKPCPKKE